MNTKTIPNSNNTPYSERDLKKKKKTRLGFHLALRASFHLIIPIQEPSTKTGQLPRQDCVQQWCPR